jgi:hypothetical protein
MPSVFQFRHDGATTFADQPQDRYSNLELSGTTVQQSISKQELRAGPRSVKQRGSTWSQSGARYGAMKNKSIQMTMVTYFYRANADYGAPLANTWH